MYSHHTPTGKLARKANALHADVGRVHRDAIRQIEAGEIDRTGEICACNVALTRLSWIKPELARLRRRASNTSALPEEIKEASRALEAAEKKISAACGQAHRTRHEKERTVGDAGAAGHQHRRSSCAAA